MSVSEAIGLLAGTDCSVCKYFSDWSEQNDQNFVCKCEKRLKAQGYSLAMADKLDAMGWCEYFMSNKKPS